MIEVRHYCTWLAIMNASYALKVNAKTQMNVQNVIINELF